MEIKISLFAVLLILFFINTVLDHLFNWWFRNSETHSFVACLAIYFLKTIALVLILNSIT